MATRYCGQVKITVRIVPARHMPHGEQYACVISLHGKHLGTMHVGIPAHITRAIDSPEEYDDAARAALSFAADEEERGEKDWGSIDGVCDYGESSYFVRRGKEYSTKDRAEIERIQKALS